MSRVIWTSVQNGLPPLEKPVIVLDKFGIQYIAVRHHTEIMDWYTTFDGNKVAFSDVLFWMEG